MGGRHRVGVTREMKLELKKIIDQVKDLDLSPAEYEQKMKEVKSDIHGLKSSVIDKRRGKKFSLAKDRQYRSRTNLANALNATSSYGTRPKRKRKWNKKYD